MRKYFKIFIDLDGTICGETEWSGFWSNTLALVKTKVKMDIPKRNWSILTSRPKIDRVFINWALTKHKLFPDEVITANTWFYKFKDKEDVANWKASYLSKLLLDDVFLDKVVYVDDDDDILSNIITTPNLILCSPTTLNAVIKDLEEEVNGRT